VPLAPGDVVAGYTVVRPLGSGGMGAVYLVRHPRLPRLDALKLLKAEFSADPDFSRRFLREAESVAQVTHRNVVQVLDRGEDGGRLWLTMQYVDGIDAEEALAASAGLLPAERVAHIVTEVAAALDAAHRHHIVHRDVKPANILLGRPTEDDEREQVFLTDFGIARSLDGASTRLTRTGAVVATFDYASPEQIESRTLDPRTDVYSLGCVLFRLLTGSVPYPGAGVASAIHGHLQRPPPRPTALVPWLAPGIDDVVARAMAKDPAERYPTCRALASAAAGALAAFPPPPDPPYTVLLTGPDGAVLGPVTTDRLTAEETGRLVDLLQRTRFFDLPEDLHRVAGRSSTGHRPRGGRPVALEVRAGRAVARVAADLEEARRPPALDDLVEAVAELPQRGRPPAPATVRGDVRYALPAPRPAPAPPVGPGGPSTPWTPAPTAPPRSSRRRPVLLAVALVVVVAAAVVLVQLLPPGDDGGGGDGSADGPSSATSSSGAPASTAAAQAAYDDLPRASTALPEQTLVVPRDVDGNLDMYLLESGGALGARLTTGAQRDVGPLISTDRRTLIYTRQAATVDEDRELWTMAVDGRGDRPLFDPPLTGCREGGRPAWNPVDQTQLAIVCYGESPLTLRIYSLDGVLVRELTPPRPYIDDLAYSPDGTEIAYWAADSADAGQGRLYAQPADGSGEARPLSDGEQDNDPAWSPDGSTIALSRGAGGSSREIAVVPAAGGQARSLVAAEGSGASGPAWSPDGALIAFKSDRAGGTVPGLQWWIVRADGSDPRQVTTEGRAVATPAWGHR
jgi:hypothetical protein